MSQATVAAGRAARDRAPSLRVRIWDLPRRHRFSALRPGIAAQPLLPPDAVMPVVSTLLLILAAAFGADRVAPRPDGSGQCHLPRRRRRAHADRPLRRRDHRLRSDDPARATANRTRRIGLTIGSSSEALEGADATIVLRNSRQAGPLWQPHAAMSDWNPDGVAPCACRFAARSCCPLACRFAPTAALRSSAASGSACRGCNLRGARRTGRRRDRVRRSVAAAGLRLRHSGRLHPVRADADRRRAVPSQDAAGRAHRPRRDRRLQARVHGLQDRPRPRRPRAAHAARMGGAGEPVPAADGLRDPVAPFREEPHPGRDAGLPARRMAGRARAARDRVRALELPRQHRGRADRRHDGAPRLQGQSAHRLPRGDRGGLQRRRLRQRGRRHHHHDDVDRRHQPAVGRDRLCGGGRRLPDLRHPGRAAAAPPFADPQGCAARPADRMDLSGDRRRDPGHRDPRQRHRQPEIPRRCSTSCR